MGVKKAKNGKEVVDYNKIPALKEGFFQHIPGVYCNNCGEVFALYSYSAHPPSGTDENGKPYYNNCFKCDENFSLYPETTKDKDNS